MIVDASVRSSKGVCYERIGRGEPLVLLHGFGASRRAWDPVMNLLTPHRDVVTVDLPGFGASRWPKGSTFGIDTLVDHLGACLDDVGLDRPHLAGNSLGGLAALELARRNRAASVTALAPAAFISLQGSVVIGSAIAGAQLAARFTPDRMLRSTLRVPPLRTALLMGVVGQPAKLSDDAVIDLFHSMRRSPSVVTNVRRLTKLRYQAGGDITVPVTLSWGTRDPVSWRAQVRAARQAMPSARMVPLPQCGHVPMFDNPDLVSRVLLEGSAGNGAPALVSTAGPPPRPTTQRREGVHGPPGFARDGRRP